MAQAGDTAQSLWERYHAGEETFELLALQRVASGVTRAQLIPRPRPWRPSSRLALCRDGITMQEFFELWREWQQGQLYLGGTLDRLRRSRAGQ